ncbi:MAG: type I methionyl aminopeptidase, partial [Aeromicrobium sp.]
MFGNKIEVKTPDQLAQMRQAGLVVAAVIDSLRSAVAPGVTTAELNDVAHETIRSRGAA